MNRVQLQKHYNFGFEFRPGVTVKAVKNVVGPFLVGESHFLDKSDGQVRLAVNNASLRIKLRQLIGSSSLATDKVGEWANDRGGLPNF